jgi:hypothetical protein
MKFSATAGGNRRRCGTALAVFAAAAAVAGSLGAASAAAAQPGAPSFGAAAGAAVQQTTAGLTAARAADGTAAAVPWHRLGQGWALVEYTTGSFQHAGPVRLYLISPTGVKYLMHQWPATRSPWQLIAWSGDKKRALFETLGSRPELLHQLTLTSGKVTSFRLPVAEDTALGYTQPGGLNLLVATGHGIARFSLAGVVQKRLIRGDQYGSVLASANGLTEVVNDYTGVSLVSNAGGLIRRLPVRGADPEFGGCTPVRWWTDTTALVMCMPVPPPDSPASAQLWLVPVSGKAPRALTPVRNGKGPDLGDLDAWRFGHGLYVEAYGACGTRFIGRQAASGSVSVLNVRGSSGNNVVVATSGSRMLVQEFSECSPTSSVVWFKPTTRAVQQVLHGTVSETGVIAVVGYDANGEEPLPAIP